MKTDDSAVKNGDYIVFSTADWNTPYWTNKQHTTVELAKKGNRVLYINSIGLRKPTFNNKDLSRIYFRLKDVFKGIVQVNKNIWTLSPLTLPFGHKYKIVNAINRFLLTSSVHRFCKSKRFKQPVIWTYHPYIFNYLDKIKYSKLIYHCVDDLAAVPGVDDEYFNIMETVLIKSADVIFTTSHLLQEKCSSMAPGKSFYLSNVADYEHFSLAQTSGDTPIDLLKIKGPRLGYVGALSDFKIDFQLVYNIAINHPEWSFVFIGEEREGQNSEILASIASLDNVYFLGYRKYEDLPHYLSGIDVALLPSLINQYTASMFPMKFFEYLFAGVPVVATNLPALREMNSLAKICTDRQAFEDAITYYVEHGFDTVRDEVDKVINKHTWSYRLDKMLEKLEE